MVLESGPQPKGCTPTVVNGYQMPYFTTIERLVKEEDEAIGDLGCGLLGAKHGFDNFSVVHLFECGLPLLQ